MNNNDQWNSRCTCLSTTWRRGMLPSRSWTLTGRNGFDDIIGKTTLPLGDLIPNKPADMWLEFPETKKRNAKNKKPPMTANIEITYIPFDVIGSSGSNSGAVRSLVGVGMLTARLVRGNGLNQPTPAVSPFCEFSCTRRGWARNRRRRTPI